MKPFYYLLFLFLSFNLSYSQTTPIPDANFEQDLVTQGIDTNGLNGNILNVDAQSVTNLTIARNDISNFTGLEAFINLITLDLGKNEFLTVPLTTLTLLEEFVFDDNNILDSLDLTQNVNLRILNIGTTGSTGNASTIRTLDLSQNVLLETAYIYAFLVLDNLIWPQTNTLRIIRVIGIDEDIFDFTNHGGLEELWLNQNRSTTSITLPAVKTVLRKIDIRNQRVANIDLSGFVALEDVSLSGTEVEVLILPTNTVLKRLNISRHKLPAIFDLTPVPNIENLTITSNLLTTPFEVNLRALSLLTDLNLSDNKMINLDITQNTLLINLNVNNNELPTFDSSKNIAIITFYASNNKITTLDLTNNIATRNLNLRTNLLPTLNLTTNIALENVNLGINELPILDITTNIAIETLYIDNNLFTGTGLDLTQNIDLNTLDVSYNQIESLDITQNAKLFNFNLSFNIFPGNDILNQFTTIVSNQGRLRGRLIANNNLLFGPIPDFYGIYDPAIYTARFELFLNENRFHFGDIESQHSGLVDLRTTLSRGSTSQYVIRNYYYAPQAKVNAIENPVVNAGDDITLTTTVRGAQNHYKWFKDGVEILDAPDAPEYTITDVNSCDAAVYHSEITSDLMPFEDGNPPGTNGKNLLLVRNDITLTVTTIKDCITLLNPADGDTNVAINTGIEWVDNPGACSYKLLVTDLNTGTVLVNNVDVGEDTIYNFASDLPINSNISVVVTPVFDDGDYTGTCTPETFTTSNNNIPPDCTLLTSPIDGTVDVSSDLTNIQWRPANGADGYRITITGSSSTINNVTDLDITTGTIHNFLNPFDNGETVTVYIEPYNTLGTPVSTCVTETFTIETAAVIIPNCTTLISPLNTATGVSINSDITWNAVANATGYFISIGTTSGGTDLANAIDIVGTNTYNPPADFPDDADIFVTITPYNSAGSATGCTEESFSTETIIPNCTTLSSPLNTATGVSINSDITWNAIANATGYFISIGTTSGGTDLANAIDIVGTNTYNPPTDFPDDADIFVTISPYNSAGSATGCAEESFSTETVMPNCTTLISPLDTATGVSINSDITWNAVANATGYFISIGTTSGGTDLANAIDVVGTNTYNPPTDFPDDADIFVTISPYNSAGSATGCAEESFSTETVIPNCTTLISPLDTATGVSINSDITWNAVANATGYFISIGTTSGGTNLANAIDIVGTNTYNPPTDFPDDANIFVTITPYNSAGSALGCAEESFSTETVIPNCTTLISPLDTATGVSISSDITWNAVANATGYFISIGTTSGGTDLANTIDIVGTNTYNPPVDFPDDADIFVTITPYNSAGSATGCTEEGFRTEAVLPGCSNMISPSFSATNVPIDTNISWSVSSNATYYTIGIGTSTGSDDILTTVNVGNVTTFDPPTDLPSNTTIYITITAYNSLGLGTVCGDDMFSTEEVLPVCTDLISPVNGETSVSVSSNISWNPVSNATGYFISVGTTSGGTDLANAIEIIGTNTYNPPTDFPDDADIFVAITPYNSAGSATGCVEERFTTESILSIPTCTTLSSPVNGSINVSTVTNLNWNAVANADGYLLTVSTTSGINNVSSIDVTTSNYNFSNPFNENDLVTVTIIPYNASGQAVGCSSESFTIAESLSCTSLVSPLNNANDVSVSTDLTWNEVTDAVGYTISVGTTPGGSDILTINWSGNTYDLDEDLPEDTQIFVTIIPFNTLDTATGCTYESFTTEKVSTIPDCTTLINPINSSVGVSINSDISWNPVANATGYFLSIGTTSGGTDLANTIDIVGATTYNPPTDFPVEADIFVTITPYNSKGNATGCAEEEFSTESVIPECSSLIFPLNGDKGISVSPNITWEASENASGYLITLETTTGAADIIDTLDVGNDTNYNVTFELPDDMDIFVIITPYNSTGNASGCIYNVFSTESRSIITPAYFTPNGDSYNDVWKVEDPKNEIKAIYIFDRYGKLLKTMTDISTGWDGSVSGKSIPTSDYWCTIELFSGEIIREHFTLKR